MRSFYKLSIFSSILLVTTCEDKNDEFGLVAVSITLNQGSGQNNRIAEIVSSNITKVTISISGVEPVNVDVSSGQTVSKTIDGVPVGEQTVRIDLKNSSGTILYTQTQMVNVEAGQTSSPSFPADDFIAENVVMVVTSPNGGEDWELGSIQDITWTTSHSSEDVSITLYKDGISHQVLTATTSSIGSYTWTISSTISEGSSYKIRVTIVSNPGTYDESNGDFTLSTAAAQPTITVISPNGGENWELGSTQEITWSSSNVSGNVKIELYKSGSVEETLSADESNDGSYSWTISSAFDEGTDYRARISSNTNLNVYDESDGDFIISNTPVTDIDGNIYQTVQIGNQLWMAENLTVTHYRNGDEIPTVNNDSWASLWYGACTHPSAGYLSIYGRLYNWYAVDDSRNIAPEGWHVPTFDEWQELVNYLGGEEVAGGSLREVGTEHWCCGNTGATNESGFTALPAGVRDVDGLYYYYTTAAYFWSSSYQYGGTIGTALLGLALISGDNYASVGGSMWKVSGFSVRCVKD